MRQELKLNIWSDGDTSLLFTFRRGADRRNQHKKIIIDVLMNLHPGKPTKDNLQRLARIRRSDFLKALYGLMAKGTVFKFGAGKKADPCVYGLPNEHASEPKNG